MVHLEVFKEREICDAFTKANHNASRTLIDKSNLNKQNAFPRGHHYVPSMVKEQ